MEAGTHVCSIEGFCQVIVGVTLKVFDALEIVVLAETLVLCFKADLHMCGIGGEQLVLCKQGEP
jgi:hypothetical protein